MLDGACAVFDAVEGVEPQTETVWRQADKYHVPRICFINKMDRIGADFFRAVQTIQQKLRARPVSLQIPIGAEDKFRGVVDLIKMKGIIFDDETMGAKYQEVEIPEDLRELAAEYRAKLEEAAAEVDDALMDKYLDGHALTREEILRGLRKGTLEMKFVPVLCGSAFKNKGVQQLLDAVVDFLPSPLDIPPVKGVTAKGDEVTRASRRHGAVRALAFKIMNDPFVGNLTFFRVYSGTLEAGSNVYNATNGQERAHRPPPAHAREQARGDQGGRRRQHRRGGRPPGHDAPATRSATRRAPIVLERMELPGAGHLDRHRAEDEGRPGQARRRAAEARDRGPVLPRPHRRGDGPDDHRRDGRAPPRDHRRPPAPRVQGRGERRQAAGRLPRDDHEDGRVRGHATSSRPAVAASTATCWLRLDPREPGQGFVFENDIVGGVIPKEFIPPIEKGIEEAMTGGVLAGYPMVDVKVALFDGSYHDVDSSEMAFEIAGSMGFQDGAARRGRSCSSRSWRSRSSRPSEYMGDVIGDLNSRRGKIHGMNPRRASQVIEADVPLAEMFGYATDLRSKTQGRATYTMQFSHYAQVPDNIAETIVAKAKGAAAAAK